MIKLKSIRNRWWLLKWCQHDAFAIIILCSSNNPRTDVCALLEKNESSLFNYTFAGVTCFISAPVLQTETFGRVNGINSFIANLMASKLLSLLIMKH